MLNSQLIDEIEYNCFNQKFCSVCRRIKNDINYNGINALYICVQDAVIDFLSKDKEKKVINILNDSQIVNHCYRDYAEVIYINMVEEGADLEAIVNIERAFKEYIIYFLFKIYGDPSNVNNKLRQLMQAKIDVIKQEVNNIYTEIKFQEEVAKTEIEENVEIIDMPKAKQEKRNNVSNVYSRSNLVAKRAIVLAGYYCEIDKNHKTFTSKYNDSPYVEVHHLIPMEHQDNFDYSVDTEANIISLCPTCHKKMHHGCFEDIIKDIKKLYNMRKERLKKSGIILTYNDLEKLYV